MTEKWNCLWDKFNKLVLDDFSNGVIDEEEMERRLDKAESDNDPQNLMRYAKKLGYNIKPPK